VQPGGGPNLAWSRVQRTAVLPVTPYGPDGEVDLDELAAQVARGVDAGAGGVFAACGTGEFSALEPEEYADVVRVVIEAAAGRVPVFAGAGGPVRTARRFAGLAAAAGADGILLPPYLTEASGPGLVRYVRVR
jgi:5-dehydro-4-deoxyglucarate dehydratase